MEEKERKPLENQQSPEVVQDQSDMNHMCSKAGQNDQLHRMS